VQKAKDRKGEGTGNYRIYPHPAGKLEKRPVGNRKSEEGGDLQSERYLSD